MAGPRHQAALAYAGSAHETLIPVLARRLAAAGMGVEVSSHRRHLPAHHPRCSKREVPRGTGHRRTGPLVLRTGRLAPARARPPSRRSSPTCWAPPQDPVSLTAYRALPLKGQVGRTLQDQGLTVVLRVSEDWDSFEATTDIDITSPARPWLGTITLSDDAALDWHCDLQAAFHGNPAALIDTITPVLRRR